MTSASDVGPEFFVVLVAVVVLGLLATAVVGVGIGGTIHWVRNRKPPASGVVRGCMAAGVVIAAFCLIWWIRAGAPISSNLVPW
jgi:hypothetical protein